MNERIMIRDARIEDGAALARLAGQLGYPCDPGDVATRITGIIGGMDKTVLVAETGGAVIGWLGLEVVRQFYLDPFVDVHGFVVDENFRGRGIGNMMLSEAERWTAAKELDSIRIKTNALRKDAHRFYERCGYTKVKEQFVYRKNIG